MGDKNIRLHNTFMVSFYHILSPWFTCLHFDFHEMYLSYHDQMSVLARYIIKKMVDHNHATHLVCELSILIQFQQSIFYLCTPHQIVSHILLIFQGVVTTKTSSVAIIKNINWLYVQVHVWEFIKFSCILLIKTMWISIFK